MRKTSVMTNFIFLCLSVFFSLSLPLLPVCVCSSPSLFHTRTRTNAHTRTNVHTSTHTSTHKHTWKSILFTLKPLYIETNSQTCEQTNSTYLPPRCSSGWYLHHCCIIHKAQEARCRLSWPRAQAISLDVTCACKVIRFSWNNPTLPHVIQPCIKPLHQPFFSSGFRV